MSKNIILFGQIGAGKDSVAQLFIDMGYKKGKLGEDIRKDVDRYVELLRIDKSRSRDLYVKYGQSIRELFHENVWCEVLNEKIEDAIKEGRVIIADARQFNEYEYFVSKLDFVPIGVIADEDIRKQRLEDRDGYDQSSQFNTEIEMQANKIIQNITISGLGYIVENNGSLQELKDRVEFIIKKLKEA